jgi:hypothetical protein
VEPEPYREVTVIEEVTMNRLTIAAAVGVAAVLATGARFPAAQEPDGKALYEQHRKRHGAAGHPVSA